MSEYLSFLSQALSRLDGATESKWDRARFLERVLAHGLRLYATTPVGTREVMRSMGEAVDAGFANGRRLAALLPHHVRELMLHGVAETTCVALEEGDVGYITLSGLKAYRTQNPFPPPGGDLRGVWMGECEMSEMERAIVVTDDTCRVPEETIAELIDIERQGASGPAVRASRVRGITKAEVLRHFGHFVPPGTDFSERLSSGDNPWGMKGAQVRRGQRGRKDAGLWCPIFLAIEFKEREWATVRKLSTVFLHAKLEPWREQWEQVCAANWPDVYAGFK